MSKVQRFLIILGIGVLSSAMPFGYMGMVFGIGSVLLNTIIISLIYKKELYGASK